MLKSKRRLLLSGGLSLLLAGCSTLPTSDQSEQIKGRFSALIQATPTSQKEAVSGKFTLVKSPQLTRLDLLTPLNGILARIEVTPTQATFVRRIQDTPIVGRNAQELTTRLLGFPIPVELMNAVLNQNIQASRIDQWDLEVQTRYPNGSAKRIKLTRIQFPQVQLTLLKDE